MRIPRFLPMAAASCALLCLAAAPHPGVAAPPDAPSPPPSAAGSWKEVLRHDPAWYGSAEAARIAENVLAAQHDCGGWDKNVDRTAPATDTLRKKWEAEHADNATIDNGASTTEVRFLGRVAATTGNAALRTRCRTAMLRSLDWILAAQYANGGWPQYYPDPHGYQTHITFNDDAMTRALDLLRDVAHGSGDLTFVDADRRAKCARAVEKGIDCILRCQIRVDNKPTVWCAQHDEKTFAPAAARAYELPSFSGNESVGIVRFLMGEATPSPRCREAIEGSVAWLRAARLTGIRVTEKDAPSLPKGKDRVVVSDPSAPPLWARFYELGTRRPFFCGRDGIVKYSLAEIEPERRNGYAWYTNKPATLLEKDYPAWKARVGAAATMLPTREIVVARDGSGQFTGVQEAVDTLSPTERGRVILRLKPGIYKGPVVVPPSAPPITLRGESAETTVLSEGRYASMPGPDGKPYGTSGSAGVLIAANDFIAENVTFENPAGRNVGQAVAIKITGDRDIFRRCRFLGWQDTLYANNGRQYFQDCYIEGHVDFIFGSAAAVFDHCHIQSKAAGYVTAQSRIEPDQLSGYVFRDCDLTGAPDVPAGSVYLGRPWRPLARVVFIDCRMGGHIRPEGWNNWGKTENEATAWFAECGNSGPGAAEEKKLRVSWAHQITPAEAAPFETRRFLAGPDNWDPLAVPR